MKVPPVPPCAMAVVVDAGMTPVMNAPHSMLLRRGSSTVLVCSWLLHVCVCLCVCVCDVQGGNAILKRKTGMGLRAACYEKRGRGARR